MRKMLVVAAAVVSGCSQGTPDEAQQQDVVAALNRGSGEACTNEATVQVIRNMIFGEQTAGSMSPEQFNDFTATLATGLELVTLDGVDDTTNKVSCRGMFVATWQGVSWKAQIAYSVQPSLDDGGGFVVYIEDVWRTRNAYFAAKDAYEQAVIMPVRRAENERRAHEEAYAKAGLFCETLGRGTPSIPFRLDGPRILEAGEALGVPATDRTFACVKRIVDRGPTATATPPNAAMPATSANAAMPPAHVVEAPPRKEDRVEYVGPPIIVPGPPPPPPRPVVLPTVITNPMWARRVQPEFPERARAAGIKSGSVSLDCGMRPNGSLTECSVVSEDPAGAGFGPAAMAAVGRARVTPGSVDRVVPGGRTRFTVSFRDRDVD
jgi:TonB family protein